MKKLKKIHPRTPAALDKQQPNAKVATARAMRRIENKAQPALA